MKFVYIYRFFLFVFVPWWWSISRTRHFKQRECQAGCTWLPSCISLLMGRGKYYIFIAPLSIRLCLFNCHWQHPVVHLFNNMMNQTELLYKHYCYICCILWFRLSSIKDPVLCIFDSLGRGSTRATAFHYRQSSDN